MTEKKAWLSALGPLIGLLLVYVFFALVGPDSFTSVRTLETIARQTAIVGTAALGMTLVIILGGMGSLGGAVVSSLILGQIISFGLAYAPQYAYFLIFIPMAIVLSIRPQGLFGKKL